MSAPRAVQVRTIFTCTRCGQQKFRLQESVPGDSITVGALPAGWRQTPRRSLLCDRHPLPTKARRT
jgi:hypothetical protein